MKYVIQAWKNHHFPWHEKEIKILNDLYKLIDQGRIWYKETDEMDEKITITIETED